MFLLDSESDDQPFLKRRRLTHRRHIVNSGESSYRTFLTQHC